MELGYQATECRGTIALEAETRGGLPPLHHHFFEFVRQDDWDSGRPVVPGARRARAGHALLHPDHHRVGPVPLLHERPRRSRRDGYRNTPLIRFVQKGKGVTNLTGEKLYEAQVIQAVQDTVRHHGFVPDFFLLVARRGALRVSPPPRNRRCGRRRRSADGRRHRPPARRVERRVPQQASQRATGASARSPCSSGAPARRTRRRACAPVSARDSSSRRCCSTDEICCSSSSRMSSQ